MNCRILGAVPGVGEDIASWVSYGTAQNTSKEPEKFNKGKIKVLLVSEIANNACIGGAMIPYAGGGVSSAPKGEEDRCRGIFGSLLCWNAAGAKAVAKGTLEECKAITDRVNSRNRKIGVALSPCTVPAKGTPTFTLEDDEVEYGVGHHGRRVLYRA